MCNYMNEPKSSKQLDSWTYNFENFLILGSTSDTEIYCSADRLQVVSRNRNDGEKLAQELEHSRLTDLSAPHTFLLGFNVPLSPLMRIF